MKYLIVGGVAGGATAAARMRRIDEDCEIILFERGKFISYANCGLPYYIGGTIPDRESLFVQTPDSFNQRFNVDVRVDSEVVDIRANEKLVVVKPKHGKEYTESYDKLLLSPGARALVPPLEGINSTGIFTLRNVEDTDQVKAYIDTHNIRRAAVVGAGFIGLEMAENLHDKGINVSIIEMANQVMAPVDFSTASHLHQHLTDKKVALYLSQQVQRFERHTTGEITVHMASGKTVVVDMVILSIGVRPNTQLADKAGAKIGEAHGIWVDSHLETTVKDIYAVGDAIEYPHPVSGLPYLNYLANPANRQARIVADNMIMGNKTEYEGAIGTAIAKVFDMVVGTTGLPAKRLKMMNIPYLITVIHSNSHAGYYPGALPITVKLTFAPKTGKILGGQIVGYEGVDKRIDQIALVIKHKGTIYDLMELEHAYAPPFSSAKDPIALAGYTASNILNGSMPTIHWRELRDHEEKYFILDVRTADEFSFGSMKDAVNIPLDELRDHLDEIPKDKPIVTFCAVGLRGYLASRILFNKGFTVVNLLGGYKTYATAVAPIATVVFDDDCDNTPNPFSKPEVNIEQPECLKDLIHVDASGMQCPGPILKVKENIDKMTVGQKLEIVSTDVGFARDADSWCETTGNCFVSSKSNKGQFTVVIEKGEKKPSVPSPGAIAPDLGKTLIMFSDDFDKAIANFILANGAAATGKKTSIFFTFWGLNLLKKTKKPSTKKDFFGKMFSMMMPSNLSKLALSKMNFGGMGTSMMKMVMKKNGVNSLEEMRQQALDNGVEFIACQMSMDLMGVKKEELIDGVTIGGVATYMNRADKANVNLFI